VLEPKPFCWAKPACMFWIFFIQFYCAELCTDQHWRCSDMITIKTNKISYVPWCTNHKIKRKVRLITKLRAYHENWQAMRIIFLEFFFIRWHFFSKMKKKVFFWDFQLPN
jgi:hypothetical protein